MPTSSIKRITATETWPIRHWVMWPNKPFAYIQIPQDDQGLHYGLFVDDQLVSVVSLFVQKDQAQFRKFATLQAEQGKGYGSQLLQWVFQEAKRLGVSKIWCNARRSKVEFYTKFGMQATDISYSKGGIDYIVLDCLL